MESGIDYKVATSEQDFEDAKALFREYADLLGVDLSFQNFATELATVSQQYNAPQGRLLLAYQGDRPVGCAGIRKLDETTAELKRMYVKPQCRGLRVGKTLLERAIAAARELGYQTIRLDTLANMTEAQQLYRSYDFYPITPYRFNPLEGTVYMEKRLE